MKKSEPLTEPQIKALKKETRELRKGLEALTMAVRQFSAWLDIEMRKPSDAKRGSRIAKVLNSLEYINDSLRFGTLREDFRKPKKMKPIPTERSAAE